MLTTVHDKEDHRIYHKETLSLRNAGYCVEIVAPESTSMIKHPITVIKILLRAVNKNCDVIHCHEPGSLLLSCILKPFKKCKIIYDVHEFYPELMALRITDNKYIRKLIISLVCAFEKTTVLLFVNGVVSVNDDIRDKFNSLCYNHVVIENYPSIKQFKCNKSNNELVYVGTLTEERGIYEMVEAFNRVKNGKISIVGKFWDLDYENKVKSIANKNIKFINQIPYTEVPNYIKNARAGLCVLNDSDRHKNCIPSKFLEYMLSSKPMIVTDIWKPFIDASKCGILVQYKDIDGLTKAMQYVIDNKELSIDIGKCGYDYAINNNMTWEAKEKELIDFYKGV